MLLMAPQGDLKTFCNFLFLLATSSRAICVLAATIQRHRKRANCGGGITSQLLGEDDTHDASPRLMLQKMGRCAKTLRHHMFSLHFRQTGCHNCIVVLTA